MKRLFIMLLGDALLAPAIVLVASGRTSYIVMGIIYFLVIVYSGDYKDRRFWRYWSAIHKRYLSL